MRDHTISTQRMLEEYGFAVVVAGASLQYGREYLFPDGDTIDVDTTSTVHRKGVLIGGDCRFRSARLEFARMNIYLRPVAVGDRTSAAARPSDLHPGVHALFKDAEIRDARYPRALRELVPSIEGNGERLANARRPFKLHRYAMDFADQWAFMETSALVSEGREELALSFGHEQESLLGALSRPVQEFHVELTKPCFLFDEGVVDTTAYLWNGQLCFVHRLLQRSRGAEQLHATVVEQMYQSTRQGDRDARAA